MRKPTQIVLAVAAIALVTATAWLWQRNQQLAATVTDVRASREASQSQYGEALGAIAEIQDSLSALGVREASQPVLPGSRAAETGMSALRGREALDRIALIKAGITHTKERIHALESRLHLNGMHIAGLQHMVDDLKRTVSEREAQLAVLSGQVDSLRTEVTGLATVVNVTRDSIQTQSQTIETQRQDLGRVYYVIGSKRELERAGVVKASGGLLGLGKTLQPTGDTAPAMFKSIDTDAELVLAIPSAKARVISAQPPASYTLVPVGNQMELRITDAKEFRSVKRVVIMTQS